MVLLNIVDTFKVRRSVRSFTGQISKENSQIIENIIKECNALKSPFGKNTEISLTEPGIGTYGVISNESGWIAIKIPVGVEKKEDYYQYLIDGAFKGSVAVMKLTQNGIGTVWVGGSFNEKIVESRFPGYHIPCVIAYGISSDKTKIMDHCMKILRGRSRFDYTYLFYDEKAHTSLKKQPEGKIGEILECVRWLPSGINKQSWRISFNENERKFRIFDYYNLSNGYSPFDIGIMIGGFYFYSQGHYKVEFENYQESYPSGGKYICSIILDESLFNT
ncbi:hypothetical protein TVAG_251170 [Trichomonas vaginalis G3]|uniref:Putative nitroreductase TM1586 domain-containing protein n=1 Tax=Trichomonas vaginalis (strain ATCC PRA-98 / G3) TaxID=412133 RepID=A2FUY2_TRIV3|nr:putative TM nitroreductase family [Trichomonas vaginalis G3]EAX91273.1 hypothetical protein TVAG_251170 [Trichomonas vaginalis G3]KAI5538441.1 putative TM nitroreductase family [Trichomonas vaginalis G3]|eukprot:XP_001304203.1 hypothetical protein [Trichomonas vaginalis G3]